MKTRHFMILLHVCLFGFLISTKGKTFNRSQFTEVTSELIRLLVLSTFWMVAKICLYHHCLLTPQLIYLTLLSVVQYQDKMVRGWRSDLWKAETTENSVLNKKWNRAISNNTIRNIIWNNWYSRKIFNYVKQNKGISNKTIYIPCENK